MSTAQEIKPDDELASLPPLPRLLATLERYLQLKTHFIIGAVVTRESLEKTRYEVASRLVKASYAPVPVSVGDLNDGNLPAFLLKTHSEHVVFLAYDFKKGMPSVLNRLNLKREAIVEGGIHLVLFLLPEEETLLARNAPDFFRFCQRTIDLRETHVNRISLKTPSIVETKEAYSPFVFSPDSRLAAFMRGHGEFVIREVASWDVLGRYRGISTPARSVCFSNDAHQLLLSDVNGKVLLLEGGRDKIENPITLPDLYCTLVGWSPDGNSVVLVDRKGWFCFIDTTNWKEINRLDEQKDRLRSLSFHPAGKYLAMASKDWSISLYALNPPKLSQRLRRHSDVVYDVAFSPDGNLLASGSADQTVRLWNPESGEQILKLTSHKAPVTALAFSPDNYFLLSGDLTGRVIMWDLRKGKDALSFPAHKKAVGKLAFSPDQKQIYTFGEDGKFCIWEVA